MSRLRIWTPEKTNWKKYRPEAHADANLFVLHFFVRGTPSQVAWTGNRKESCGPLCLFLRVSSEEGTPTTQILYKKFANLNPTAPEPPKGTHRLHSFQLGNHLWAPMFPVFFRETSVLVGKGGQKHHVWPTLFYPNDANCESESKPKGLELLWLTLPTQATIEAR